ncbi:DUF7657 domain-containing protein [Paenibacillus donghaensis]|uniref:Uncharacterized protein n=1 Tax=Paenibacillus donghaensis TaxID=414771 RepID=A0A2Z2KU11_9BACL|nr:hypothetical protein [Paenibacillus donghaensis]ASA24431.1 hypothetical protein B9T62_28980 [Paenibacillus donghaensis]
MSRKKVISLLVLIFVIYILQLLFFNFSYFTADRSLTSEVLSVNEGTIKDLEVVDGSFLSTTNDPWIDFHPTIRIIKSIEIEASYENSNSLLQVFYTVGEDTSYSEANSKVLQTKQGKHKYSIDLGDELKITSFRVDITNLNNEKVGLNKFTLNPHENFIWNTKQLLLNTLLLCILMILSYLIYKKIDLIIKYRYQLSGIIFVILVLFKLHGSSIGMWDKYITQKIDTSKQTTLIGTERSIRSDEWLVQVPYMLSQVNNASFNQYHNELVRSDGQNMLLANTPTFTIETLGKPFYWGFLIFNADYGLSWYWFSKMILLLLLSFEISMFLTRENKILSILGSLWIAFSPPIQWWYTTGAGVVELIIYSQAIVTCAIYYFKSDNIRTKIFLWGAATLSLIGFVYTLYPAVQVPLMFLILIFLGVLISDNFKTLSIKKIELYFIIVYILLFFFTVFSFLNNSMSDIKLVLNTIYPGKRMINGGDYSFSDLQLYLINWLLPFKDTTFSNNSAVSSLFNFVPLIMISFIFINKIVKNKKMFLALFLYLIFQISWLFVDYPYFIAKITLFSFVPEARLAGISFGITAVYISIWFVGEVFRLKPFSLIQSLLFCILTFFVYLYSVYSSEMHNYLGAFTIATLLYYTLIHFFLLKGYRKVFLISMLLTIFVSGLTINPIARGTDSIYNKKITQAIESVNEADPDQKWVATDSIVNGQLLIALGVKSFNSVQFYPDLKMWRKLDEEGEFNNVYNRYAHVIVSLTQQKTEFILDYPDRFTVKLDISDLPTTGIRYILSSSNLDQYDVLKKVYYEQVDQFYIYKVKESTYE